MSKTEFSGEEIVKVLTNTAPFHVARISGNHVILKYNHPSGETRTVAVPLHDSLSQGTLRQIADASGAKSFEKWSEWIEANIEK